MKNGSAASRKHAKKSARQMYDLLHLYSEGQDFDHISKRHAIKSGTYNMKNQH